MPELKSSEGKAVTANGAISIVGSSGESYRLLIYNCRIAQALKKFRVYVKRQKNLFIIRKAPRYLGRKVSVYKRGNASTWISKISISDEEKELMKSGRTIKVGVMIYPAEFSLSFSEALGTEAVEDGVLAEALSKRGLEVKKFGHQSEIKGDLDIALPTGSAMVEITRAFPDDKVGRGKIKSYEILGRFYYALKWANLHRTPAFVIIHEAWEKGGWIKREKEYLQKMNVYLLFTNFEDGWSDRIADEILNYTWAFNNNT